MKEGVSKNFEEKSSSVKSEDIEKALLSIADRFHLDLSQGGTINETLSVSSRKALAESPISRKRDIGYTVSDENADFRILELIKKETRSHTYLVEQISLKRTAALKIIGDNIKNDEASIDQFTSEAHFTGQLSHPNIIPVHDAGMDSEGRPFYVLKNTQGVMWDVLLHPKSDEEIKKAEKYSLSDHLEIMESVCNAVAFAHSRGVIHRDIKPANVLIGEFGEVIVMNWGLTISVEGSGRKGDLTETNAFGGTISYMSHEVARADAEKISRQSDIYLLGAILYEILTGHPPHQAKTVREALTAAMQNRINPPDEDAAIDSELMAIALKAMATEPSSRHANIIDFQKELKSYKAHEESRSLTENARLLMEHAQKHDKRIEFIRATVLLEEALQLWAGNTDAKELIEKIKKDHGSLQGEFNKNLVKLIVRGEIFNILFKTLIIPIYLMLLVLPFFFYFYVLWANPLYKIGKINVRQLDKWQQDKEVILSEHFIHNVYLLFDGNDLYQVVIHDNRIKMRRLNTSKLPEKAENKYYIESFEWIVKKAPFEIFVDELSLEIFAPDRRHPRVFNPLLLLKAKKSLNESRKN